MAIIATLFGGIIGFVSFATAMLAFDASFLTACGVYMMSGFATTAAIICTAMIPARDPQTDPQTTAPA